MGTVTNHLKKIIARQVEDHHLVVWFDPEGHYRQVTETLELPGTTVACYRGSFFALRYEIEPLMGNLDPPKLLIYVPLAEEETLDALAAETSAGVVLKPGQHPWLRNTRLSVIARHALKPVIGENAAVMIEKQVEAGKLSLAELDKLAEKGEGFAGGVVSAIFGTGDPPEVALAFLSSEQRDQAIVNKRAIDEVALLLGSAFEVELPPEKSPEAYRACLSRYILATAFIMEIKGAIPEPLATVKVAKQGPSRQACLSLAKIWRLRGDLRESYVKWASWVEKELELNKISFGLNQISSSETFLAGERSLQKIQASVAMFCNTNQPVEVMVRSSHLFLPLPDVIREDMAFLDRLHFYLPGWEIPKMRNEFFTNHYGFVVDYLAEALREMRKHNYTEMIDRQFFMGSHLNARDVKAVRKTVSGLIKLIYPHGRFSKEEFAEVLDIAMEGRRRVKEQLKKMGSYEYHQTSFSYIDNETRAEYYVGVPEEGGRNLISTDPLAPGSVYTASVDDQGKVGLYRIEVGMAHGTGKLKIVGGIEGSMKESIQRAFAYLQSHKVNIGIAQTLDTSDFHVEAIDLLTNRISCEAGVALIVAIYSATKKHPALPGLLILGDISIQGNLKALRSLVEPLQMGMDNGARRALIPIENKRNFLDVPAFISKFSQ